MYGILIFTACFFLLFTAVFFLCARCDKSIRTFLTGRSRQPGKSFWDTTAKALTAWGFILFSRKLTYYLPLPGVIQTKTAVWCTDGFFALAVALFLALSITVIQGFCPTLRAKWIAPLISRGKAKFHPGIEKPAFIVIAVIILGLVKAEDVTGIPFDHLLLFVFSAPLVVLKVIFPGTVLGFLTSLVLPFLAILAFQNLEKISLTFKNKEAIFFFLFIAIMFFTGIKPPGDWKQELTAKIQAAKTPAAFTELLEAAHSARDVKQKSEILEHIAVAVAKTGDTQWASAIAGEIPDEEIKNRVLKETGQTGN